MLSTDWAKLHHSRRHYQLFCKLSKNLSCDEFRCLRFPMVNEVYCLRRCVSPHCRLQLSAAFFSISHSTTFITFLCIKIFSLQNHFYLIRFRVNFLPHFLQHHQLSGIIFHGPSSTPEFPLYSHLNTWRSKSHTSNSSLFGLLFYPGLIFRPPNNYFSTKEFHDILLYSQCPCQLQTSLSTQVSYIPLWNVLGNVERTGPFNNESCTKYE